MKGSSSTPRRHRRLTPKQRVLRKYPNAWSHSWRGCWAVYDGNASEGQQILGEAISPVNAWKLAAMRIAL